MSPLNHLYPLRAGSSFYKSTREDGLYSAVKFFPSAFSDEKAREFDKRVALVRQAINEYQAEIPHVTDWRVKTEKPFIEFDWIVGMSLAEKFRVEKNSLLTVSQVSEVAEQISKTLTLCHKIGLQHGAVSMKEMIWDAAKKRYVLAGFFSNIFSGADAEDLQKKDIKDLSVVLLQLLTGREDVQVMDEPSANLARENAIPSHWSIEDRKKEKEIPSWLWQLIAAGRDGNQFSHMGDFYFLLIKNYKHPVTEKSYRSKPFAHVPSSPVKKIQQVSELYNFPALPETKKLKRHFVFDGKMAAGFLIAGLLFGFSMFSQKKQENKNSIASEKVTEPVIPLVRKLDNEKPLPEVKKSAIKKEKKTPSAETTALIKPKIIRDTSVSSSFAASGSASTETEGEKSTPASFGFFMVKSKAYFHTQPDEATKRKAFIIHWNNAILVPEKEENDFFYVVFTNHRGQTSRGWLKKSDLVEVGEK